MNRGLKQFVYGAGFLLFFSGIIFGAYSLLFKAMPTCSDNRQNGAETGVDCGGACVPCGQKYAQNIEVDSMVKFPAGDARTVVVAYLKNPNDDFGFRDVIYTITAKGASGEMLTLASGHMFMYDRAARIGRYIVATIDVPIDEVVDLEMAFSEPQVVAKKEFVEPRVNVKRSSTDVMGVKKVTEPSYVFTKDLAMKATGDEVKKLEEFLFQKQFFKKGTDGVFDLDTRLALIEYQKARKISPASGIFDAKTRAIVNTEVDRVTKVVVEPDGTVSINGNVKNDDIVGASKVVITGLLYDSMGIQLGGSKTELDDLGAAEERTFKIAFPKTTEIDRVDTTRTRLFVDSIQ